MMARRYIPKSVEELAEWYMRYVSPLSLIAGIVVDNFFLARRVDLILTNALLFTYLIVSALAIFAMNMIQTGHWRHSFALKIFPLLPVVAQFAFGGLFSAYFVLYSRSATIAVTWIFIVVLIVLMIGNERFAKIYSRFTVQASIYFTALFAFLIFFLPLVFHKVGALMFVFSGMLALAIVGLLLIWLYKIIPELNPDRWKVRGRIVTIFIIFNLLYITGAIPPLPLSLKTAGVYHAIERSNGDYILTAEALPWYKRYLPFPTVYHTVAGEPAYVFTSIFAPTGLSTTVVHEWQKYDEAAKAWVTKSAIEYTIHGGNDYGYRGYSQKGSLEEGEWRVNVETKSGLLIGRVNFAVETVSEEVETEEEVR